MDSYIEYAYQPRVKTLLLAVVFFGACGAVLAHIAMTNRQGLVIDWIIELSRGQATVFYWVLAGLSGGFVAVGLLGTAERMLSPEKPVLRLTPHEVIIPPFLFRRESTTVLFRDITSVTLQNVQGQHFIILRYGDRKKAHINRGWLTDEAAYQQVLGFITEKVKQNSRH